jgi:uncharacterized membrane protein
MIQHLKSRPRLVNSFLSTIVFALVICNQSVITPLTTLEKVLFSYNFFQWIYLFSLLFLIFKSKSADIKKLAMAQDESTSFVLPFSSMASIITLAAIGVELSSAKETHGVLKSIHLALPAITLIGVWALLPTLFAIHYAHMYYLAKDEKNRPMTFPDSPDHPDYFDFLYFSVTVALTSQTSDTAITSSIGRKIVLMQSIVAFLFNTSILALGINVAASLLN